MLNFSPNDGKKTFLVLSSNVHPYPGAQGFRYNKRAGILPRQHHTEPPVARTLDQQVVPRDESSDDAIGHEGVLVLETQCVWRRSKAPPAASATGVQGRCSRLIPPVENTTRTAPLES